ncbi:MAG: cofactor-independent phosphoglycerate mutase [Actinobacteria bacterium HGW-Actinobacteria-10]|nr:MAG: cofactor-independent phosphoglycerate mutase [Actinobacteria bacterium HGW-Actinobacteria-10]
MKYCIVILDGAAGWPLPELGGRTSLEYANTPNLDGMARAGTVGMAYTVPEGMEPSSSAACTSIIGYDPVADYVGRGAIEAASMGIKLRADEVALRVNLVSIKDGVMSSYSGGSISTEDSRPIVTSLARHLNDETFTLYPGIAYRHILVVKGHPELVDLRCTPPHDISDKPVEGRTPAGEGSELLLDLMDRARPLLQADPVVARRVAAGNVRVTDIWPFWPGVAPRGMVPFFESRGVRAAMTSGVDLLNGLAVLADIDRLEIAGVSDGPDNDYKAQALGALAALDDHDLVIVHVESPDEAGHSGDHVAKVAAIEAIDRDVLSHILRYESDIRVLAMPDHPTPVALKTHVGEPVPFVLYGPGVSHNGAAEYTEAAATATGMGVQPGRGVMDLLLGR